MDPFEIFGSLRHSQMQGMDIGYTSNRGIELEAKCFIYSNLKIFSKGSTYFKVNSELYEK